MVGNDVVGRWDFLGLTDIDGNAIEGMFEPLGGLEGRLNNPWTPWEFAFDYQRVTESDDVLSELMSFTTGGGIETQVVEVPNYTECPGCCDKYYTDYIFTTSTFYYVDYKLQFVEDYRLKMKQRDAASNIDNAQDLADLLDAAGKAKWTEKLSDFLENGLLAVGAIDESLNGAFDVEHKLLSIKRNNLYVGTRVESDRNLIGIDRYFVKCKPCEKEK
jgi:hypothetical protein